MKKKKKNRSKYFYIFIGILISSFSIVFASSIIASQISYTPTDSNWAVNNVQTATDSLYYSISRKNPVGEIIAYMGNNPPEFFWNVMELYII